MSRQGRGVSLLVPFTPGVAADRDRIWAWLERYWRHALPDAEIVTGHDPHPAGPITPFSKTAAVNQAAGRAHGDIFCIIDADALVAASLILHCATEIRSAHHHGRRLWFVPYRRFYRANQDTTRRVLNSNPRRPWLPQDPPPAGLLDPQACTDPRMGHHYAAMIMILPRQAFEEVGGMDPRFAGWGGEDISFMRALDTIYATHKTVDRSVFHLWHDTIGRGIIRRWQGQRTDRQWAVLGSRYLQAMGDRERMLKLTHEWQRAIVEQ